MGKAEFDIHIIMAAHTHCIQLHSLFYPKNLGKISLPRGDNTCIQQRDRARSAEREREAAAFT